MGFVVATMITVQTVLSILSIVRKGSRMSKDILTVAAFIFRARATKQSGAPCSGASVEDVPVSSTLSSS